MALPREFVLAAACAIWPPSEKRSEAIRKAAAEPLDWDRFLRIVNRHRVAGLANDGLKQAGATVPAHIGQQLGAEAIALARDNLRLAAEAARLQREFAQAALPVAFVKGVPLALVAYGTLALRHNKDIDLLVAPTSLSAAAAVLEHAGYRRVDPPPGMGEAQLGAWVRELRHFNYVHGNSGIEVELHWRLFRNPRLIPAVETAAERTAVLLSDGTALPTLAPDDLFAYLCAHGAAHCWFRLKWLADIAALLAQGPAGEPERLYRAAQARGVGPLAAQAILLCRRLLATPVSAPLIAAFRAERRLRWLERTAMKAMTAGNCETEPTALRFGARPQSLAQMSLLPGWRYPLAEFRVLMISAADIKDVPLPERMSFLYPVLRLPLALWRAVRPRTPR